MRLTKLSAALAAIALSLVGLVEVAAPANASPISLTATASVASFNAASASSAFSLSVPAGFTGGFTEVLLQVAPSSGPNWTPKSTCTMATTTLANCGIAGVKVNNVSVTPAGASKMGSMIKFNLPSSLPASNNSIEVSFASGAFTVGAAGAYQVQLLDGLSGDSAAATVASVSAPSSYTVTFDANGGTGSIPQQTASQATNLTSNTTQITRTGFDFAGWNTAANGSGTAYANGASFPFTSSATLYAQWTAQNGSSTATAGTGSGTVVLNLAVGQPIAGAPVDLNVTGMQAGAAWDTTVRSTPQSIGAGTIPSNGNLTSTVYLPSNLGAGWHSITFTSTDASGNPFTTVSYFQVSASGTLVSTSNSLASTGAETFVPFGAAAALLLAGAAIALIRRRTAS